MLIPVAEWVPDASDFGNPGSIQITNAVPKRNSYGPCPSLVSSSNALDDYPRGAIEAVANDGNVYQYAGDENELYELSGQTWSKVSKVGGYTTGTDERWEFVRWRDQVLGTNFSDSPQEITFGATNFADLTTALRFRHIAVIRDFVFAGSTWDSTDGEVRDRARWCAQGNPTDWTVDPTTGADVRDLNVGGGIQRIFGGSYGVIFSEGSGFRVTWAGAPTWFEIDETLPGIGIVAPGAGTRLGDAIYVCSQTGFYRVTGGQTEEPIGGGRVDDFFANDVDESFIDRMSSVADPNTGRIFWAYPGSGNTGGRPNKMLIYDTKLNRWGYVEDEVELLWQAASDAATTLDGLDAINSNLDALGASLDSDVWKGAARNIAAFNEDFEKANFVGAAKTATVVTRETEINRGRETMLSGLQTLVDGGTTTVRVGTRNKHSEAVTFSDPISELESGKYPCLENGKFHRFEMTISGDWDDAIGVVVNEEDARAGARRG